MPSGWTSPRRRQFLPSATTERTGDGGGYVGSHRGYRRPVGRNRAHRRGTFAVVAEPEAEERANPMAVTSEQAIEPVAMAPTVPSPARERLGTRARRLVVAADALCVAICLVTAFAIRARGNGPDIAGATREHLILGTVALPVWLGLFARQHLYAARFIVRRVDEWKRIVQGSAQAVLLLAAVGYAFQLDVSRAWLVLTGALTVAVVGFEREVARRIFGRLRRHGRLLRDVVIVGSNDEARELTRRCRSVDAGDQ